MRNWNTDTSMFKDQTEKRIWEISQILEYGSEDGRLPEVEEIKKHWEKIRYKLSQETRRLWEIKLWDKVYSLPTKDNYWTKPPEPIL